MENQVSTPTRSSVSKLSSRSILGIALAGLLLSALVVIHRYLGEQPMTFTSPLLIFDRLFDIAFVAALVLLSIGVGRAVLRLMRWSSDSHLEASVCAFGIGMGILSLVLIFFGFAKLLYAPVVLAILIAGLVVTWPEWRAALGEVWQDWTKRVPFSRGERWMLAVLAVLTIPVFLGGLVPPFDSDALTYHLVAPLLFLQHHSVIPTFDNIGANYPIAVDLLYVFGMSAGSDIAAGLIHLSFGIAISGLVYTFATRYLTRAVGLLAIIVFWSSSVVALVASAPIIDLGWVFYETLALYAFFLWRDSHRISDLVLAGIGTGMALSNKYLAAVGAVVLGVLILVESVRGFRDRKMALVQHALIFGSVAFIVALPWYLKNWIWLGNPVYPFFLGSYGVDGILRRPANATGGIEDWVAMGMGHDWRALLTFPLDVYIHWQAYGANRAGPTLYFLFLPVYLRVPRRAILNGLFLIVGVRFLAWWEYAQNIRYLLVIFPWISLAAAYSIQMLVARMPRPPLRFALGLVVGLICLVGIFLEWGFFFFLHEDGLAFQVGLVSRETFLEKNLLGYPATRFINDKLPEQVRILQLGEKRVYYVKRPVMTDDGHANWNNLVHIVSGSDELYTKLRLVGFTHIWVSEDDALYARNAWNIPGPFSDSSRQFADFRDTYLRLVYSDDHGHSIYELHE